MAFEPAEQTAAYAGTDVVSVQRRTVRILLGSQALGSIAVTAGIAMGGLVMEYATGSQSAAGFAQAASTLGGALVAVPAARLAMRSGRRVSLAATYLVAALGAALVVLGTSASIAAFVLIGMFAFGAGTAASMQVRFAGVDLATPQHRGRTLSLLLFAVTIGGVIGPNLAGVTGGFARSLSLPEFAGPFFVSIVLFLACAVVVSIWLRPDPLVLARSRSTSAPAGGAISLGTVNAVRTIWSKPGGRLGLLAVMGGHATMVAVMVMTPVQIAHAGHGLSVVGIVISGHVVGMYAFSPVMGWLADKRGPRATVGLGAAILLVACAVSGLAADDQPVLLGIGLFLLGLGWSACMVGGSLLVTLTADEHQRPAVQGSSDMLMGLSAAIFASASGLIVAQWGYGALCLIAAILVVPMVGTLLTSRSGGD
ncbi:MFS transporter [Epidermidibacterium keratini]|uniref:MFS transporter n=1 Tax=Epidermidibacterium keratini TaxID=1891644 RepID=A0A7L4YRQ4_9ACTN|nr:MFS transporter [Epidermidibacterium keratini]QHC01921.1 MFS transporter [Epidermidibacterium keratini]